MRMLLFYILLVAFGCQQTPFLESENLKTSESEKGCEQRAMSNETFLESENLKTSESEKVLKIFQVFNFSDSQIQKDSQVFSFSVSQILYFENQIRLADSLYKNYLPQYNFEEVKAAVMFFDSLRLTTDLFESENLKISETEKGCEQQAMSNEPFLESENLKTSESEKGSEPRAMSHEQKSPNVQSSKLTARSSKP